MILRASCFLHPPSIVQAPRTKSWGPNKTIAFAAEIPMLSPVIQPLTKGRRCALCNKGPLRGEQITRRGLAKSKGGVGRKITGRSKRSFKPNLQKVRAVVNGKTVRLKVCTSCLRLGRVQKPA